MVGSNRRNREPSNSRWRLRPYPRDIRVMISQELYDLHPFQVLLEARLRNVSKGIPTIYDFTAPLKLQNAEDVREVWRLMHVEQSEGPTPRNKASLFRLLQSDTEELLKENWVAWQVLFTAYGIEKEGFEVFKMMRKQPDGASSTSAASGSSSANQSRTFKKDAGESASPRPSSSSKSCSESSGSRKNSSEKSEPSSNSRLPDSMNPEEIQGCCEGNHYECERHSHVCAAAQTEAPCDCCRHGHSISSLIRPDDCRSCLRQMGGLYMSPKYPQLRQKMLKTLNRRRDCSEEMDTYGWTNATLSSLSVIQKGCSKKETIMINTTGPPTEDVDALVRMIEGTKISNDPKKAAKKARQKEKKLQVKLEEERQREEEERKKREEEERIRREQELFEEEERRKAEEQKRMARKAKKKNRKKRAAANSSDVHEDIARKGLEVSHSACNGGSAVTSKSKFGDSNLVVNGLREPSSVGSRVVGPTSVAVPEVREGETAQMVTIRRHPSQGENFVTISLKGNEGDDSLLYYLVDGQLFPKDAKDLDPGIKQNKHVQEQDDTKNGRKKKKKKSKASTPPRSEDTLRTISSAEALRMVEDQRRLSLSKEYYSDHDGLLDDVDLSTLKLPPGITITKVTTENGDRKENISHVSTDRPLSRNKDSCIVSEIANPGTSLTTESFQSSDALIRGGFGTTITGMMAGMEADYAHDDLSDDFFMHPETEEFEEVVSSKTRRKRNKAAAKKEMDGTTEDPESLRSSPCSGVSSSRRMPLDLDKVVDNNFGLTNKWTSPKTLQNGKSVKPKSTRGSKSATYDKAAAPPVARREQASRNTDSYGRSGYNKPVMPRLSKSKYAGEDAMYRALRENSQQANSHLSESELTSPNQASPYVLSRMVNPTQHNENYIGVNSQIDGNGLHHAGSVNHEFLKVRQPRLEFSSQNLSRNTPAHVQPPAKVWDHGEISAPALGPFTVQAKSKANSWNPWKDWGGPTPEDQPLQFTFPNSDYAPRPSPKESTADYYSGPYPDIMRPNIVKSPIQRPLPNSDASDMNSNSFYSRLNSFNSSSNKFFCQRTSVMSNNVGAREIHLENPGQSVLQNHDHSSRNIHSSDSRLSSCGDRSKLNPMYPGNNATAYNLTNVMDSHPHQHPNSPSSWGSENVYEPQAHNSYIPRGSLDKQREFSLNQASQHVGSRNDIEWNHPYAGSCSPLQESEMYNRQGFPSRPRDFISPRAEPVHSESLTEDMWDPMHRKMHTHVQQSYPEVNLSPVDIDWPRRMATHLQLQTPTGPIIPTSPSPLSHHGNSNWINDRVQLNHTDFTSGAHP